MSKRKHTGKGQPRQRSRPTLVHSQPAPERAEDQELIQGIRRAMRADHPLPLLESISQICTLTDPRPRSPFERTADSGPPVERDVLIESLVEIDIAETTAALTVLAAFTADDLEAARLRQVVDGRRQPLPDWMHALRSVKVRRIVELTHVLGDGDDIILGVGLGRHEFTVLVYIDHNMGTLVKDAFVLDRPIDEIVTMMRDEMADAGESYRDLDPADARARITGAIERAAITYPPLESDTWPGCRTLVEWAVRTLPADGTGYTFPEWTEEDRERIAADFFASPHGWTVDDADGRSLVGNLVWFGTEYAIGDPFRWSPVRVEMLLADWLPRKIVAEVDYLSRAPEVLRHLIRFAHEHSGISEELTQDALGAVDHWEPEYQLTIRTDRPRGPEALLAAMGLLGGAAEDDFSYLDEEIAEVLLEQLALTVGGEPVLMALDTEPLPDEDFDWTDIPAGIHPRVTAVLELSDRCCTKFWDTEARTACRRLLSRAAAGDPVAFRRRGRDDIAAAAICWLIGGANGLTGQWSGGLLVRDLLAYFGVGGHPGARADSLARAAGLDRTYGLHAGLGEPGLLTSVRRAYLIAERDRLLGG